MELVAITVMDAVSLSAVTDAGSRLDARAMTWGEVLDANLAALFLGGVVWFFIIYLLVVKK